MSKKNNQKNIKDLETTEVVEEVVDQEETTEDEVEEPTKETKQFGKIIGCTRLRIRKEPNTNSDVLGFAGSKNSIEIIEPLAFDPDFYKVSVSGIEGFCMKKFIELL